MPSKSQHSQRKLSRSKRRKGWQGFSATQQQAVAQTREAVVPPGVSVPVASVPTPMATQTPAHYPYIVAELRRIGILAGIMVAIIVVLALVLA